MLQKAVGERFFLSILTHCGLPLGLYLYCLMNCVFLLSEFNISDKIRQQVQCIFM
jgi:hypothetical protein